MLFSSYSVSSQQVNKFLNSDNKHYFFTLFFCQDGPKKIITHPENSESAFVQKLPVKKYWCLEVLRVQRCALGRDADVVQQIRYTELMTYGEN